MDLAKAIGLPEKTTKVKNWIDMRVKKLEEELPKLYLVRSCVEQPREEALKKIRDMKLNDQLRQALYAYGLMKRL